MNKKKLNQLVCANNYYYYSSSYGAGACVSCPSGASTQFPGATSYSQCYCPENTYYSSVSNKCISCSRGMTSTGGSVHNEGYCSFPVAIDPAVQMGLIAVILILIIVGLVAAHTPCLNLLQRSRSAKSPTSSTTTPAVAI